nr:MAG TPA: hypothetical protein [Caudoviricetes sp.]
MDRSNYPGARSHFPLLGTAKILGAGWCVFYLL